MGPVIRRYMKEPPPSSEAMAAFDKIFLIGLGMLLLAFIPWVTQDFVSSMAATQVTTKARLRTTGERDDPRVLRAFRQAAQRSRVNARLATETNPEQQTRDSLLTVTAKSKHEALADLETMTDAIKATFA